MKSHLNLSSFPKVLVNICRRSGVAGKDITEEKKVSYLSALVTLLQVPEKDLKMCTMLTSSLDLPSTGNP